MGFESRLCVVLSALILLCATVSAVSIGAGPSTIEFGQLVKGGYAEEIVTLSTSGDEDLTCSVEFTGDIKDWLSVDKGDRFNLPANSRLKLKAIIQPPSDAPNGKYEGAIYIKAAPTSTVQGGAGLAVGAGVKIRVSAEITGEERMSLAVRGLKVLDTEVGYPIGFEAYVLNTGNIKVKPRFVVDFLDSAGVKVLSGEYGETEVLPTREEKIEFTVQSTGLQTGRYTADVKVYGQDKLVHTQVLVLNMLAEGSWSMDGELADILVAPDSASPGDAVKVTAVFTNTGQTKVKAKLKAEAHVDGKLKDVLDESEEMAVAPAETVSLETYYTPDKASNYMIKGYVLYNGKRTETKGALLKVSGGGINILYIVGVVLLLAIVAFLKFILGGGKEESSGYAQDSAPDGRYQEPPPEQTGGAT